MPRGLWKRLSGHHTCGTIAGQRPHPSRGSSPLQRFARLYAELDATTSTRTKVEAMERYFRAAEPRDAAWALYFLAGNKPRQIVPVRLLARLAVEEAGIPDWLFEESYRRSATSPRRSPCSPAAGTRSTRPPRPRWHAWVEARLLPAAAASTRAKRDARILGWLARARRQRAALRAEQADHRRPAASACRRACVVQRASRRRVRTARPSAWRNGSAGALGADARRLGAADCAGGATTRRSRPAVSVLPRLIRWRPEPAVTRRAGRVASRMEVGRHPRPADPPRGAGVLWSRGEELVDRTLPGDRRSAAESSARRHACSTARCSRGATARRCRSPCCRSASAARR